MCSIASSSSCDVEMRFMPAHIKWLQMLGDALFRVHSVRRFENHICPDGLQSIALCQAYTIYNVHATTAK